MRWKGREGPEVAVGRLRTLKKTLMSNRFLFLEFSASDHLLSRAASVVGNKLVGEPRSQLDI